jgi:hypothetical protein
MQEVQLWKKQGETFNVEILVGQVWVQHNQAPIQHIEQATALAERQARETGVNKARVCSSRTTVNYAEVASFDPPPPTIAKAVKGFTPTGEVHACRICSTPQPVAEDGSGNRWVFCEPCKRTIPL